MWLRSSTVVVVTWLTACSVVVGVLTSSLFRRRNRLFFLADALRWFSAPVVFHPIRIRINRQSFERLSCVDVGRLCRFHFGRLGRSDCEVTKSCIARKSVTTHMTWNSTIGDELLYDLGKPLNIQRNYFHPLLTMIKDFTMHRQIKEHTKGRRELGLFSKSKTLLTNAHRVVTCTVTDIWNIYQNGHLKGVALVERF